MQKGENEERNRGVGRKADEEGIETSFRRMFEFDLDFTEPLTFIPPPPLLLEFRPCSKESDLCVNLIFIACFLVYLEATSPSSGAFKRVTRNGTAEDCNFRYERFSQVRDSKQWTQFNASRSFGDSGKFCER